jgi:hypothetical protein
MMFVFASLLLVLIAGFASATKKSTACLECTTATCALIPPASASSFPCYEGNLKDSNFCYDTV